MSAEEKTFIPDSEFPKIYRRARIYVLIYVASITTSVASGSWLPVLFIGLPNLFGT